MPFEVTASQKDQTLPMILTLRGDEAIVDEFTYDSDQAMSYLGIKRSRLNQISGRELRVARIRRDRYIRPVYREADLKDYLEWTRATATHLSSSKAIEQAVENLDDRFNDVLQVFNEKLQQVTGEQQGWMKGEFERLPTRIQTSVVREIEAESPQTLMQSEKVLRQIAGRVDRLGEQILGLEAKLSELTGIVDFFVPEMKELNVGQKSLRFDFDKRFEAMIIIVRDFQKSMSEILRDQGQLIVTTSEQLEALIPESIPMVKPKRQRKNKAIARRHYFA